MEANNAAAIREAAKEFVAVMLDKKTGIHNLHRLAEKCRDALAAPPRNCDRFATVKDAAIAFARERQDALHPCPDFIFSTWLYAPATEQKGEQL